MAFKDFAGSQQPILLLQRSLERGRLAHAYLFTGQKLTDLELFGGTLAKTLNCQQPIKNHGLAIDSCDQCSSCRRIDNANYPDIHWVRPASKLRIIKVEQMRDLIQQVNLRPAEALYKVAIIVGADRLTMEAANAFLKTL